MTGARPVATAPQPVLPGMGNQTFVEIAKAVKPAVVNIYATKTGKAEGPHATPFDDPFFRRFFGVPGVPGGPGEQMQRSLGSGVIVDAEGHVLTNDHVVSAATKITVATRFWVAIGIHDSGR